MTEYLKDLERHKPGDELPPINVGPYDNPLLWNMLDPYGADRPHQRRPLSVSRTFCELQNVPLIFRDHCVHRFIPFMKCMRNVRPMTIGTHMCHEFEAAWTECRVHEKYRSQLLKERFMGLTKDYTAEDKKFFPDQQYIGIPYSYHSYFWTEAASARLAGWDEQDPSNPLMSKEPNRAMMRSEFMPTNFERKLMTSAMGYKILSPELVEEEIGIYPLPEEKKATTASLNF
jgi:hypothetical protein